MKINKMKVAAMVIGLSMLAACNSGGKPAGTGGEAAKSGGGTASEKVAPIVEKAGKNQFKVEKEFKGPDGLVGLVLVSSNGGGNKIIAWTTANGEVLMPGPLFDKNGDNLSEKMLAEYGGFMKPEELATEMAKTGFVAGKSGPIINVFFEPYCGYCNKFMNDIKPYVDNGKVRLRFVMVGFLREDSIARAAGIASASDPYKALLDWEEIADKSKAKAASASDEAKAKVSSNNALIGKAGQVGTPALVVCRKDGGKVELIKGAPSDVSSLVESLGEEGHPACK